MDWKRRWKSRRCRGQEHPLWNTGTCPGKTDYWWRRQKHPLWNNSTCQGKTIFHEKGAVRLAGLLPAFFRHISYMPIHPSQYMTPSTYIHKVHKCQPYFFWQKSKQQPFPFCPLTSNNMFDPVEITSMNTDHNKSPAGRERRSEAHWREKSCRALPTLDCKTCKWLCRFNFSRQMLFIL